MLFFQLVLVLGYAYSHWTTNRLKPRTQLILHSVLMVAAILSLPVKPTDWWRPVNAAYPTARILLMLLVSVGLPFFLLSTTGPLVQAWQAKTHPNRSPFRLFALSNAASLLALISYPFLFEPYLTTQTQSWMWSGLFILFAICAIISGLQFQSLRGEEVTSKKSEQVNESSEISLSWLRIGLWLMLPMLASVQLLATTNLMTQELGSLPFLWILPLSLYLISFIICFDHNRWYFRPFFLPFFLVTSALSLIVLSQGIAVPFFVQIGGYSSVCFGAAMCCHGELARIKPGTKHLTMFYLFVSIGGALGGIAVAVVAPAIFNDYYEYQLGLILAIACCLVAYWMQKDTSGKRSKWNRWIGGGVLHVLALVVIVACGVSWYMTWKKNSADNILEKSRTAYGTLKVEDKTDHVTLTNGATSHGIQFKAEDKKFAPSSYYGPTSGLGRSIKWLRQRNADNPEAEQPIDFGTIGLGVGTVSSWCQPGDTMRIFEINPDVERVARRYFSYLEHCKVEPEIVLGDARLQLERELDGETRKYDLLIADAFSSDSVPMHLLTLEALEIYQERLKPHGILAVHVSNRFLNLHQVVVSAADELGLNSVRVSDSPDDDDLYFSTTWVLVCRDNEFPDYLTLEDVSHDLNQETEIAPWTDDFASIIPVLKWGSMSEWIDEIYEDLGWDTEEEEEDADEDEENEEEDEE